MGDPVEHPAGSLDYLDPCPLPMAYNNSVYDRVEWSRSLPIYGTSISSPTLKLELSEGFAESSTNPDPSPGSNPTEPKHSDPQEMERKRGRWLSLALDSQSLRYDELQCFVSCSFNPNIKNHHISSAEFLKQRSNSNNSSRTEPTPLPPHSSQKPPEEQFDLSTTAAHCISSINIYAYTAIVLIKYHIQNQPSAPPLSEFDRIGIEKICCSQTFPTAADRLLKGRQRRMISSFQYSGPHFSQKTLKPPLKPPSNSNTRPRNRPEFIRETLDISTNPRPRATRSNPRFFEDLKNSGKPRRRRRSSTSRYYECFPSLSNPPIEERLEEIPFGCPRRRPLPIYCT